jgi:hypothetical protein
MPEMLQDGAFTYSTGRTQGSRGNFQYLTERTDGVSSHLGCLIRTRVRHNDNPQRVPPTGIIVRGKDTEDALGYRGSAIARWNDDTNGFRARSEPKRRNKTRHLKHSGKDGPAHSFRVAECA